MIFQDALKSSVVVDPILSTESSNKQWLAIGLTFSRLINGLAGHVESHSVSDTPIFLACIAVWACASEIF
jgi:hypothetical protein